VPCNSIDDDCDGLTDENNINGCTNPVACNYNPAANCDNGSCQLPGCYDPFATNYNPFAPCGGGNCVYEPTPVSITASAFPACNAVNGTTGTMDPTGLPGNGPNGGNPNDEILYVFNMPTEGAVKVVVNGTGINAVVELLNASYGFLSAADANATMGGQEVLFQDGLVAGTYVVRVYDHGNGAGGNFNICISTYASSKVDPPYNGLTYNICDVTKCTHVASAVGYSWVFTGQSNNQVLTYSNNVNYTFLTLSSLTGGLVTYGEVYDVEVGANYNDPHLGSISVFGVSVNTLPITAAPQVQLATAYIGGNYQLNNQIKSTQSCNADGYVWRLTPSGGPALADVTVMGTTFMTLCTVAGILPGQTYSVQIAVIYGGITYGFGPAQNINTAPYVPVVLRAQDNCTNVGTVGMGYTIFTNVNRPCAKDYTWEFTPTAGGLPIYHKKGNGVRTVKLNTVSGLLPGQNYNVRMKAEYGNFTGFHPLTGQPQYDFATAFGASDMICLIGQASAQVAPDFVEVNEAPVKMSVYPNPASEFVNIAIDQADEGKVCMLIISDMYGRTLESVRVVLNEDVNTITLPLSGNFAAGLYTVRLVGDNLSAAQTMIISK